MTRQVVVVACSAGKTDRPATARHLYTGTLFRKSVDWAEAWGLPWVVLSALHGLVLPETVVAPYEHRLAPADRDGLVARVRLQSAGLDADDLTVLAGNAYADVVRAAVDGGPVLRFPFEDLPDRGLGYYLRWLDGSRP